MIKYRWFQIALLAILAVGCGQNKFEKEVENEKLSVQLAREVAKGEYDLITAEELKKLVDEKKSMVIIDAMPLEASYNKAHVPGAKQFLFSKKDVMETWDTKQTGGKSEEDYAKLLGENKEELVVVYCGFVKCLRSHNAALWAKKLGYNNVKRFPGGIYAWKGKGFPTEPE